MFHLMRTFITIVLVALFIAGCSKLTMENYNRLKPGMSYDEVVALIGSPDKCGDVMGMKNCSWGNEDRSINVTFAGDKVLFFAANGLN